MLMGESRKGHHRGIARALAAWLTTCATLAGLAVLTLATPAIADAPWFARTQITAEGAVGYDNNAFRQNRDSAEAAYSPFSLDVQHDLYRTKANRLRIYANLDGNRYADYSRDANRETLNLGAQFRRSFYNSGTSRLELYLDGGWRKHHQVYVSRLEGEEYTITDGGEEISLRDRFNSSTWAGLLGVDCRILSNVAIAIETEFATRNYDQDYNDSEDVEPLDYQEMTWRFDLSHPTQWGRLRLAYETAEQKYRDYSALDREGDLLPEIDRSYRFHVVGLDASFRLFGGWTGTAQGRYQARVDQHVGYYDYNQWSCGPRFEGPISTFLGLHAGYDWVVRDYPRAHIYRDPDRRLREEKTHIADTELTYSFSRPLSLFLRIEAIWHNNRNEDFSYNRTRTWLGVRFSERLP